MESGKYSLGFGVSIGLKYYIRFSVSAKEFGVECLGFRDQREGFGEWARTNSGKEIGYSV